jgi:ParB family chromosome partitioning protein
MTKIKVKDIIPFKDHPYKVEEDDSLKELMDSIEKTGLIHPVIVREKNNKYEMISGHRRLKAYELLGIDEIEADIKELTDDEAIVFMVDSNIHREKILPSEKAFAYKMKLDAIKHQGKKLETSETEVRKTESADKISDESAQNVRRYVRLTYLIPELLQLVDDTVKYGKNQILTMGIKPAVEISYLTKEEQKLLYSEIVYEELTPSHAQAIKIRELSKNKQLNDDSLEKILDEKKGNQNEKISFNKDKIVKALPYEMTKRDKRYIEDYIIKAIEAYRSLEIERGDDYDLDI